MKRGKEKIEININIRNEQIKSFVGFRPKDYYGQDGVDSWYDYLPDHVLHSGSEPYHLATTGMDKGALFTATAIASAIATFLLAFMAKLPFAQAPSMGLNAFFAFTLCQAMGLTWQQALAVLLVEGIIFLAITFLNIRDKILECIPKNLRFAISAGIGMFIAFIGLKNAGIITANADTFVQLGKFTPVSILGLISILLCGCLMARRVKALCLSPSSSLP